MQIRELEDLIKQQINKIIKFIEQEGFIFYTFMFIMKNIIMV
jgi:hypothetical protein